MNIHEYQAKKLLKNFKINIPKGLISYTPLEAQKSALKISPAGPWVLKAQIQAGARAKGHFLGHKNKISGVEIINRIEDIKPTAEKMLGGMLWTPQTLQKGKLVSKIYVEAFQRNQKTFYLSFVINRIHSCITLLAANVTDNIVDLAQKSPNAVLRLNLDLHGRIKSKDISHLADFLKLPEKSRPHLKTFVQNLSKAFVSLDATLLEINPVGLNDDMEFTALDAKISFDNNALFRHQDIALLQDDYETNENTLKALKCGFKYREFDEGNIGLIVNGDGLASAVQDYLKQTNHKVACALNIKGGVDEQKISDSLKIMMTSPKVEGIIINILGGFLRCNLVADGIISALSDIGLDIPLVVRFEGTNKESATEILQNHHFNVLMAQSLQNAVYKLTEAMKEDD